MEVSQMRKVIEEEIRESIKEISKLEIKMLNIPTTEGIKDCCEIRGYIRGLRKGLELIEVYSATNSLF